MGGDFVKLRICIFAASLFFFVATAFTHGTKVHVLGTIEKITADSVFVKAKDGKSVEVKLLPATVYVERANNADKPARFSDLAVGYLVVIHATPKDNMLEADEVKFTVPTAAKTAAAPTKPKP
jgi:hypothetical protein